MTRRKDVATRAEVQEEIETNKRGMEEKETDLDKIASDVETVRETGESLDFEGTDEGGKEVESAIEDAENVTEEVFEKEDQNLEQIQDDNQEFEGELQDRRGSSESDLGKISDSSGKIETKETINGLEKVRDAISKDIEFLDEQFLRASEGRKQSDDVQKRLQDRVHANQGGR